MGIRTLLDRLELASWLDRVGDPIQRRVQTVLRGRVRDVLHGVWLGHPLHPALVQVPIGAWTSAGVLDMLPGGRRAATLLIGVGTVSAVPAIVAGWNDWSALTREQRRVGLVHAAANALALGLYAASLVARMSGDHRMGRRLAYAGLGSVSIGGYLGGHLSYRQAASVNQAEAFLRQIPEGWQDLCEQAALADGTPLTAQVGGVPILVTRTAEGVSAMIGRCAHLTGPLDEGELVDVHGEKCVVCPWHGSVFRLADGMVVHGPAATDQPLLRTRVVDGRIQAALP
jgi:nitrite reductase/ring-hydroxylating ferredoxin subunit